MLFSFQGGKKLHLHGSCGITWSKALKAAYLPHSGSQAEPHPGEGSPSGRQDAGSEGYLLQSSCSSANHLARPADSHSWRSWPVSYWERVRIKQTVRAIKPKIKARRVSVAGSYRVDRVWRVSKAPGVIVVSWLSYRDNRRTLWSPVKLSLWIQLILLFLNILMTKEIHINKKKHQKLFQIWTSMGLWLTTFAVPQGHGTSHFEPSPSDWLWGEAHWQRTRLQMPHPQSLWSCCCWGYCVFVGGERKHVGELKAALTL